MSTNEKIEDKSLLDMLVEQEESVHVDTDDFIQKTRHLTPDELNEAFGKKVAGHTGFSISIGSLNQSLRNGV